MPGFEHKFANMPQYGVKWESIAILSFLANLYRVCAFLGFCYVLYLTWRLVVFTYRTWFRRAYDLKRRYGADGWAATDGIGKSLAFEFASRGLNVMLISRTQERLDDTKKEVLSKYPKVEVETLQVDFARPEVNYNQIATALRALKGETGMTILVNNVGMGYDFPMYFTELSMEKMTQMIRLNMESTTMMSKLGIEVLQARKQANKGAIVNIGSAAGLTSNPLLTQYSASKAYVQKLSEGLAAEALPGIALQVHVPYFIVSKLSKFRTASLFVPSSQDYAKRVVDCVGCGEVVINPYPLHALTGFVLAEILPTWVREWATLQYHKGIRAKGLKKHAATTKKE